MASLQDFFDRILESAEQDLKKRAEAAGVSIEEMRTREAFEQKKRNQQAESELKKREERTAFLRKERDIRRNQLGSELRLNTACHIGHVVKLSGLGARSSGTGWDRATVWHIVIDGEMKSGRLTRSPGDLLCRKSNTLSGRTMGVTGRGDWEQDTDPNPNETKVTCKSCLAKLTALKTRQRQKETTK